MELLREFLKDVKKDDSFRREAFRSALNFLVVGGFLIALDQFAVVPLFQVESGVTLLSILGTVCMLPAGVAFLEGLTNRPVRRPPF
jgi:hypothetical protein